MTPTHRLWQRLTALPLGNRLFSIGMSLRVPYFATILPTVKTLRPGHCEVSAPKWWGVHNHLRTFHAIAACNLAEIAMGMLAEATVPPTHRWIPKSMTVTYLSKARTSLHATAHLDAIPTFPTTPIDLPVPVSIRDKSGIEVITATITIHVSPA
ncbi:hotdog fold domain-containing protein [Actinokineospora sp. NPDC004072]